MEAVRYVIDLKSQVQFPLGFGLDVKFSLLELPFMSAFSSFKELENCLNS